MILLALALPSLAAAGPSLAAGRPSSPAELRARVAALQEAPVPVDGRVPCLTGLVRELKEQREAFSAAEWAEISATLGLPPETPAPPAPTDDGACTGPTSTNMLSGEHFVIYWGSRVGQSEAEAILEVLEYSYDRIIGELGWKQPTGMPSLKLRFQITDQNYAGAYTTVDRCSGVGYVPYMVSGAGSFSAGNWYKTMGSHEFMHTSQFSYGYAHEFFWWEASATWSEEYAYSTQNDWADMYAAFSYYPHIGLNAFSQSDQEIFYHMYAMGIFATYLDENWGGHDIVQDTWEEIAGSSGYYSEWMPDVLEDLGLDFDEVWQGFMATTAFMDFRESNYYMDPRGVESYRTLPASGTEPSDAAQSLGMNYFSFDADLGGEGQYLQIDFLSLEDIDWNVVLATGSGNDLYNHVALNVVDGQGSAWIPFTGEDDAMLIVSPKDKEAQGPYYNWERADEYAYDWSACVVDRVTKVPCGEYVPGGEDTGDTGDGNADDLPEEPKGGCSCSAGAGGAGAGLWLLGLVPWLRRRR